MTRPAVTRPVPRSLRRAARSVGGMVGVLAALAFLLGPASGTASAHGGPGSIEVLGAAVTGATVDVRVKVTFTGDGHEAEEATVTVAGSSGGGELTPVPLAPVDGAPGVYAGTVTLPSPGDWSLRITSVEPPGTVTVPVTAAAPAAAPVTAATGPPTTPTTDPSTAGDAGGVTDDAAVTSAPADAEEGSGGSPWVWVLGGAGALAAVAVGAVFVANGRRSGID